MMPPLFNLIIDLSSLTRVPALEWPGALLAWSVRWDASIDWRCLLGRNTVAIQMSRCSLALNDLDLRFCKGQAVSMASRRREVWLQPNAYQTQLAANPLDIYSRPPAVFLPTATPARQSS